MVLPAEKPPKMAAKSPKTGQPGIQKQAIIRLIYLQRWADIKLNTSACFKAAASLTLLQLFCFYYIFSQYFLRTRFYILYIWFCDFTDYLFIYLFCLQKYSVASITWWNIEDINRWNHKVCSHYSMSIIYQPIRDIKSLLVLLL